MRYNFIVLGVSLLCLCNINLPPSNLKPSNSVYLPYIHFVLLSWTEDLVSIVEWNFAVSFELNEENLALIKMIVSPFKG